MAQIMARAEAGREVLCAFLVAKGAAVLLWIKAGGVDVQAGAANQGVGGSLRIASGSSSKTSSGTIALTTADVKFSKGSKGGIAGSSSGVISMRTGTSSAGTSGSITVFTGSVSNPLNSKGVDRPGGSVEIRVGKSVNNKVKAARGADLSIAAGNVAGVLGKRVSSSTDTGGSVQIRSGISHENGVSGSVSIRTPNAGDEGASGHVSLRTGSSFDSAGSGDILISSGASLQGSAGGIKLRVGLTQARKNSEELVAGIITIAAGDVAEGEDGLTGGSISLRSGRSLETTSGDISITTSDAGIEGTSGAVSIATGMAIKPESISSGSILLSTGTSLGEASGKSKTPTTSQGGDISITAGLSDSGASSIEGGAISFKAGKGGMHTGGVAVASEVVQAR